jgi:hypothetical protein
MRLLLLSSDIWQARMSATWRWNSCNAPSWPQRAIQSPARGRMKYWQFTFKLPPVIVLLASTFGLHHPPNPPPPTNQVCLFQITFTSSSCSRSADDSRLPSSALRCTSSLSSLTRFTNLASDFPVLSSHSLRFSAAGAPTTCRWILCLVRGHAISSR